MQIEDIKIKKPRTPKVNYEKKKKKQNQKQKQNKN